MSIMVRVQQADFRHPALYQQLNSATECGAVVTFTGLVRELASGDLTALTLEHYPGMTEAVLEQLAAQAQQRWQLEHVIVVHRTGRLTLNEQIVFVGVAAAHRKAAFDAAMYIMDVLKTRAPFWKQEETHDGSYWVAAKDSDRSAAAAWFGEGAGVIP